MSFLKFQVRQKSSPKSFFISGILSTTSSKQLGSLNWPGLIKFKKGWWPLSFFMLYCSPRVLDSTLVTILPIINDTNFSFKFLQNIKENEFAEIIKPIGFQNEWANVLKKHCWNCWWVCYCTYTSCTGIVWDLSVYVLGYMWAYCVHFHRSDTDQLCVWWYLGKDISM